MPTKKKDNRVWVNPKEIEIVNNPRTKQNQGFSEENMTRLRNGIQRDGLDHPLLIRSIDGRTQLVAGERRLRSVQRLIEDDLMAAKNGKERVLCKNPACNK